MIGKYSHKTSFDKKALWSSTCRRSLPERRNYEIVAGLVIGELQHLPNAGEAVETLGWRFEVIDMDGRRIDKVLAQRITNSAAPISEVVSIP